jgi:hypothetical protein
VGRSLAGTGLDRLSALLSGLAHQRHTKRRIGIAMSGNSNPAEISDLGEASTWVFEDMTVISVPYLTVCAMRISRILGSGPRSY